MTDDDLAAKLAAALNERWPGLGDGLQRRPSQSTMGTPLFYLYWSGSPGIGDVRQWLDRSEFREVSVMFAHGD